MVFIIVVRDINFEVSIHFEGPKSIWWDDQDVLFLFLLFEDSHDTDSCQI